MWVTGFVGVVVCSFLGVLVRIKVDVKAKALELFGGVAGGWEPLSTSRGALDLGSKSSVMVSEPTFPQR